MGIFQNKEKKDGQIRCYGATTKGSIHDKNGKPMQDRSLQNYFGENNQNLLIAVSDGHGSDPYFRSEVGAQLAIDIAAKLVVDFLSEFEYEEDWPDFVQRGTEMDQLNKDPYAEPQFRHLFDMIVAQWRESVENDLSQNPPNEEEYLKASVKNDDSIKKLYETQGASKLNIYGCTLIVAVRTQNYWLTFRLGDGTCEALDKDNNWFSPLPWDAQCENNVTTSLCEHGAESFTYCYGRNIPTALFIASDGIDDNFGGIHNSITPPEQIEWFRNLIFDIRHHKLEWLESDVEQQLNALRHYDDKSLRLWIDTSCMDYIYDSIVKQSLDFNENKLEQCKSYINKKEKEIKELENEISLLEEGNKADELYIEALEFENNHINDRRSVLNNTIDKLTSSIKHITDIINKLKGLITKYQQEKTDGETQLKHNVEAVQTSKKRIKGASSEIFVKQTMLKSYRRELEEVYRPMLNQIEQRIKDLRG